MWDFITDVLVILAIIGLAMWLIDVMTSIQQILECKAAQAKADLAARRRYDAEFNRMAARGRRL